MADLPRGAVPAHLAEHEDDEQAEQRGYVKGTDYSLPYVSQWSRLYDDKVSEGLLRHVNCGYLSTHSVPPTLLALKQHAQSLCILIHALSPTLKSAEIAGGEKSDSLRYELNDAFDFLNRLDVPYTNDDPAHHKPLSALVNDICGRHEVHGTTYHCALAETRPLTPDAPPNKPYANHHNLIQHANACLERLDHEFSSTGGLLSLLPPPSSSSSETDPANARNTLLGQWLHFTQALVLRARDLERAYANALDLLAGEAALPRAYLTAALDGGPDARAAAGGREIAYPQDRWVLANAGDDVLGRVHALLDAREAALQAREACYRRMGLAGQRGELMRESEGGADWARGVVWVDVQTRYLRLAGGGGRDTVFVLPAWAEHPAVEETRAGEAAPTVVACAQPKFPARATELEKRFARRGERAEAAEGENVRLRAAVEEMQAEMEVLEGENEALARSRDALVLAVGEGEGEELAGKVQEQRERAGRAERAMKEAQRERDETLEREERALDEVEALRREVTMLKQRHDRMDMEDSLREEMRLVREEFHKRFEREMEGWK
ncbi:hypothetical protein NEMBOFW57_006615 [Staphylotrichum longicolle]|uniref:Uncharacterized protein n=1 Tax=Staphylotrichum longicolle TaxID=669026 RepID=A0AAD4ETK8_9PEZI|nr:hypothetical protein NEMBOFW57_006615 [Staphylotrichum longicolle]